MDLIKKIWSFSINPTQKCYLDDLNNQSMSLLSFFKVLLIFFGLVFLGSIPSQIIAKLINIFFSIDLIKIHKKNIQDVAFGLKLLLTIVFLGPIFEETMFRLWLSFKKLHVALSLTAIFWFFLSEINNGTIYGQKVNELFLKHLLITVLLGFLISYIIFLKPFREFLSAHFKFFYWFSCIGFGLVHITNFRPFYLKIFWAYPFLVIPQLIMGFFFGYFRLKKGFFVSLLLHCLLNLPSAMIYYFQSH